jgi:hypothetical protein
MFFYSFDASSKTSTAVDSPQQKLRNSILAQNGTEPIIFSKYKYLKKTRKVNLF